MNLIIIGRKKIKDRFAIRTKNKDLIVTKFNCQFEWNFDWSDNGN